MLQNQFFFPEIITLKQNREKPMGENIMFHRVETIHLTNRQVRNTDINLQISLELGTGEVVSVEGEGRRKTKRQLCWLYFRLFAL